VVEEVGGGFPAEGLLEEKYDLAYGELGFVGDAEDGGGGVSARENGPAEGDYAEVKVEAMVVSNKARTGAWVDVVGTYCMMKMCGGAVFEGWSVGLRSTNQLASRPWINIKVSTA
jgi:hypothetical protein